MVTAVNETYGSSGDLAARDQVTVEIDFVPPLAADSTSTITSSFYMSTTLPGTRPVGAEAIIRIRDHRQYPLFFIPQLQPCRFVIAKIHIILCHTWQAELAWVRASIVQSSLWHGTGTFNTYRTTTGSHDMLDLVNQRLNRETLILGDYVLMGTQALVWK